MQKLQLSPTADKEFQEYVYEGSKLGLLFHVLAEVKSVNALQSGNLTFQLVVFSFSLYKKPNSTFSESRPAKRPNRCMAESSSLKYPFRSLITSVEVYLKNLLSPKLP